MISFRDMLFSSTKDADCTLLKTLIVIKSFKKVLYYYEQLLSNIKEFILVPLIWPFCTKMVRIFFYKTSRSKI